MRRSVHRTNMSKAFIKEPDAGLEEEEESPELKLPPGTKNYITPVGLKRLREEFSDLLNKKRPEVTAAVTKAAANGDRSENADYIYGKRRLREIDRRLRFLTKRIESAEVVDPVTRKSDQVFFGATVTIRDEEDHVKTYSIVGVDEIDPQKNHISWTSPFARALIRAREGDVVTFKSPKGVREVEVVAVEYKVIL